MVLFKNSVEEPRRVCKIKKDQNGFGFILCCETDSTDTFVLHVLTNSPSSKAGLRIGDRIISVNKENVEKDSHEKVVEKLQGLRQVTLLVAFNPYIKSFFTRPGSRMLVSPLGGSKECLRPRIIYIKKSKKGYDFHLVTREKKMTSQRNLIKGHFVGQVIPGGVSDAAGLLVGDRIIEINNVNVEKESHHFVIATMKRADGVSLLVVDERTDEFFSSRNLTPNSQHLSGRLDLGSPEDRIFVPKRSNQSVQSSPMTSQSATNSDLRQIDDVISKLTLSTPNLTNLDDLAPSSERKRRVAHAKREIRKQLSSRFGWKSRFTSRSPLPSREFTEACRKFYDEISLTSTEESSSSVTSQAQRSVDDEIRPEISILKSTSKSSSAKPKSASTSTCSSSQADLSAIDYKVDLKTLKEHVQKTLGRNKKAALKPKLTDYDLAHQFVNGY